MEMNAANIANIARTLKLPVMLGTAVVATHIYGDSALQVLHEYKTLDMPCCRAGSTLRATQEARVKQLSQI